MDDGSISINVENPTLRQQPWLVFSHGIDGQDQTIFSVSENKHYAGSKTDMTNKLICTCSHGWLVLLDIDSDDCFLLNLVSLKKIQLPPLKISDWSCCVLSSAPDDPNGCLVVFFDHYCLLFCRPNDDEWVREELDAHISCAIGYEGTIYGIHCMHMGVFSVCLSEVNPGFGLRILIEGLPMPSPPKLTSGWKFYMVESCGEVFVIRESCWQLYKQRVRFFDIYKVDLSTSNWEKVESIGDRAFFIDTEMSHSLSCSAKESGIKKNSIYFTGRDKGLYIFDIERKNISISLPCADSELDGLIMSSKFDLENAFAMKKINPSIKNTIEETIEVQQVHEAREVQQVHWGGWADLPQELLRAIQSHLFAGDRICFYGVCKEWQRSKDPLPRVTLPLASSIDYLVRVPSPCLMSFVKNRTINLFYPMYNHSYTLELDEELSDTVICFSKGDWLLLVEGNHTMFFLNPFTKARIELPNIPDDGFDAFCFTSMPTSSNCVVFGIVSKKVYNVKIFMTRVGEERWNVNDLRCKKGWSVFKKGWKVLNHLNKSVSFSPSQSNPVFYHGTFYCLDEEGKVGCFDPKRGDWTVYRTSWKLHVWDYDQNFLVECDDNLLSVFVGPLGRWIRVCRLDQSKMIWKNVDDLGDWMLFLSEKTCFSVKAAVRGMGNKIYLQRFHDNLGVFYSLATQRYHTFEYHTFDGAYCGTDFYGTTEEIRCTWMLRY